MTAISQASMIRGADGRLYAVSSTGVATVAETGSSVRTALRAGNRAPFDTADHEAARDIITPGF